MEEDSTARMIARVEREHREIQEDLEAAIKSLHHAEASFRELRTMVIQGESINEGTLRVWANKYRRLRERITGKYPGIGSSGG